MLTNYLEKKNSKVFIKNLKNKAKFSDWFLRWENRIKKENVKIEKIISDMKKTNPIYIPRNHIVEQVINSAVNNNNFKPMRELLEVVRKPFTEIASQQKYSLPPKPSEVVANTFCGT